MATGLRGADTQHPVPNDGDCGRRRTHCVAAAEPHLPAPAVHPQHGCARPLPHGGPSVCGAQVQREVCTLAVVANISLFGFVLLSSTSSVFIHLFSPSFFFFFFSFLIFVNETAKKK